MPLPLGHSAIGLAAHDALSGNSSTLSRWKITVFIIILSNLPDIDVVFGLIHQGNGYAFHRGPTHSITFALFAGFFAANVWKLWPQIPKMNFITCSFLILSHVLADFFLSNSPVSFFWPLEVNWADGFGSWGTVLKSVFFRSFQDAGIVMSCGFAVVLTRLIREYSFRDKPSVVQRHVKS